jgi:DNA-binding LytR/AlgR family response regulator
VVKPFDEARLADSVARLKSRLAAPQPLPNDFEAVLERLAGELKARGGGEPTRKYLQWIRASVAQSVRLIPVEQIAFLRSDEKYTLVAWEGGEALIRTPIRELAEELDPDTFAQIHRSVIVNLRQVAQVDRGFNDTAEVRLKNRREVLPVSRSFLHVFRQM